IETGNTATNSSSGCRMDVDIRDLPTNAIGVRVGEYTSHLNLIGRIRKAAGATGTTGIVAANSGITGIRIGAESDLSDTDTPYQCNADPTDALIAVERGIPGLAGTLSSPTQTKADANAATIELSAQTLVRSGCHVDLVMAPKGGGDPATIDSVKIPRNSVMRDLGAATRHVSLSPFDKTEWTWSGSATTQLYPQLLIL
ncbi:MAG: hypothetical protein AAF638_13690, partial [Pseudomonadota bacterium]